jgi:hypothetical protein
MENQKPVPTHNVDFSDTVGQQAAHHSEAIRRLNNIAGAAPDPATSLPARALDSWSSGGQMNGTLTPDLESLPLLDVGSGVTSVPTLETREVPQNFEQIMRNPHGERR